MTEMSKVGQLSFADLYLGHSFLSDCFTAAPGADAQPLFANPELRQDLDRLLAACQTAEFAGAASGEFKLRHDSIAYRVSVMQTFGGNMFVLRKIADTIASLAELGIPQAYIRNLMTRDLKGLFIVSGAVNTGKTATACALVKERLLAFGGVAVTAENPIELPLEGMHGKGICYQTTFANSAHGFAENFRHVLRWGARIVFIDDIRDAETAAAALQAGVNGQLIIGTMLAENVVQTINKLYALAEARLAPESTKVLIADSLAGVLHRRRSGGINGKLETEFLSLQDTGSVKSMLHNGQYDLLAPRIKQQMAAMIAENAMAKRYAGG